MATSRRSPKERTSSKATERGTAGGSAPSRRRRREAQGPPSDHSDDDLVVPTCTTPQGTPRQLPGGLDPCRAAAIVVLDKKWVNGTQLHYCFVAEPSTPGDDDVVRSAFTRWQELPIGLSFQEVPDPAEAELRIDFDRSQGSSWSTVGRDALDRPASVATMNFGWQLGGWTYGHDTALHEIGHAIGLPHEHQNPNAGIVWDEAAVLSSFGGPPNHWDEATTRWNILRAIDPDEVQGSSWDPDSIMHYRFDAGLILEPERYRHEPLVPADGLSARDVEWVRRFYPPGPDDARAELVPFESSAFDLAPGEQVDLTLRPDVSREYNVGTFGDADTVLVLFEELADGPEELRGLRFVDGDDDSGQDRNAQLTVRLRPGRTYVLRLRLYWPGRAGRTAVMMW